jgi:hypothetical protein
MEVRLIRVPRRPGWPDWALAAVVIWAALAAGASLLGALTGHEVVLCPLRRLTGIPCPTCGSTRAALSLLAGHVGAAWRCNPLVFSAGLVAAAVVVVRVTLGRTLQVRLLRGERVAAWALGAALVLANWAYVILRAR